MRTAGSSPRGDDRQPLRAFHFLPASQSSLPSNTNLLLGPRAHLCLLPALSSHGINSVGRWPTLEKQVIFSHRDVPSL